MLELFDKKIAFFHKKVNNKEEALKILSDCMIKEDIAKDTFYDSLLERENSFPTGLNTNVMGVAIPHTDIEHVNRVQLGFMSLKDPVKFTNMESFDDTVDVKMIFMIALNEPHQQLDMLLKLMDIFQNEELLNKLYDVDNFDDFIKVMGDAGLC